MSSHVALLAALLLAGIGTAGCTPEPSASAAEQQGVVQQGAVQQGAVEQAVVEQAPVQPDAGEHTVFSCQLSGGKIVTVTRDGGQFLYRYGAAGRPELTLEGTGKNGRLFKQAALHGGAYHTELRFVSGAYSYVVHSFPRSDIVDNEPTSGLMVFQGEKMIMDRSCAPWAAISFGDFDYLSELPDIPEGAPAAWEE